MNSTKAQSNDAPTLTPQQEISQLRQQYQAVCEMFWETVRTLSPETNEVVVLPHASDPLWEICFLRAEKDGKPDPTGRMRICASTVPELNDQQKKRVVRFLRDTSRPIQDALAEFKLPHPPSYVEVKIADWIKWVAPKTAEGLPAAGEEAKWVSVKPAGTSEKLKNIIHFPKVKIY